MRLHPGPLALAASLITLAAPFPALARTPWGMLKADIVVAVSDESQLRFLVHPVNTQAGSGSCVVVGKKDGSYFALTADHVVANSSINGGFSVDINGKAYKAKKISTFEGKGFDLAIISFDYPGELPVAIMHSSLKLLLDKEDSYSLFGYQSIDQRNSVATVAGYSMPSEAVTKSLFRKITVLLKDRISGNKAGYELAYDAATYPGMSGGGIFAWILSSGKPSFPVLIGIHGKSEEYTTGGRSGLSLGIPIDLVSTQINEKAPLLGAPSSLKDVLTRLGEYKSVCWNKSDFVNGQWVCQP